MNMFCKMCLSIVALMCVEEVSLNQVNAAFLKKLFMKRSGYTKLEAPTKVQLAEKMCLAARDNDVERIRLLVQNGADVNTLIDGETALHAAVINNSSDVAEFLLDNGADPNIQGLFNLTPLHFVGNNQNIAKLLVDHGADVNASSKWGITPLHYAAKANAYSVAELLISNGAKMNILSGVNDICTPLHYAIRTHAYETAGLLIASGANVNLCGWCTPLHEAVRADAYEMAELLIDNGANLNILSSEGNTPLHEAVVNDAYEMVKLLITKGANVNALSSDGKTPLYYAGASSEVRRILVTNGANEWGSILFKMRVVLDPWLE